MTAVTTLSYLEKGGKTDALCERGVASRRNGPLQGGDRRRVLKPDDCGAERESKIIVIAPRADILLTQARSYASITEYTQEI